MKLIVYNKKTNKIKKIISFQENLKNYTVDKLKQNNIISTDDDYKTYNSLQTTFVKDIRAIKEDGSILTLEEQIKNNIIPLEKDEEIRNGQIYKLNKNNEEDLIKLIEKGIEKLEYTQKIETNEDGVKHITNKNYRELYKDKLISKEEYNNYIIRLRQSEYTQTLDSKRAELLDKVLKDLDSKGLLSAEEQKELKELDILRADIKKRHKKI